MGMRTIVIGISLFWMVEFSMSGLSRAVPSPYDQEPGMFAWLSIHHLFGFAEFGIASLFCLAALFALFGTYSTKRDSRETLVAAVTGALVLTAATHAFGWLEGRVDASVFVEAGLLLMTGAAALLFDGNTVKTAAAQDDAILPNDYLKNRIAAATASVHTFPDARPRS
ncbi:membrane hypothetical protein [Rhizobium sp. EC-SD404]|nr:membrane hypothetical protein [Rhizobium sp. EC-SD404]